MAPRADDLPTLPQRRPAAPAEAQPQIEPVERADPPSPGGAAIEGRPLGRYRLLFRIARGGMGSVYAAILEGQHGVHRTVAIKLLNSEDRAAEEIEAFVQEAKLTARITHPNVLDTFELGMEAGEPFLVMPLVRGVPLSHLLARGEPLDPDLAAWIAVQIASGLHAAHELKGPDGALLGVIHRDVSPQNVLLSYEGRVLLLDFGVAKLFEGSRATESGVVKGKFGYMSPEQLHGEPLDRRTDVFALGIVLYEMLVGRPLYAALPPAQATYRIAAKEIPRARDVVPTIPEELDHVIASALARDRAERFETALELRDALRSYLRGRAATVDEADLVALLDRRFHTEREAFDARLRTALAGRAAPDRREAPADDADGLELQTHASKDSLPAGEAPKRHRGAWTIAVVAASMGGLTAFLMGLRAREPAEAPDVALATASQAQATTMTVPSSSFRAFDEAAPTPLPSASTAPSASAAPATAPAPATGRPPKPKATAQPAAAPTPAPPVPPDPRGEPFRDL